MSDYKTIRSVSKTLEQFLKQNITLSSDAELNGTDVFLLSPQEMHDAGHATGISLWLFQVSPVPQTANAPVRAAGQEQSLASRAPVQLHYLITPFATEGATQHTLLGRVSQVLHDHSIFVGADLQDVLAGTTAKLHVTFEELSLQELSLVWQALRRSYQPSLPYLVQIDLR